MQQERLYAQMHEWAQGALAVRHELVTTGHASDKSALYRSPLAQEIARRSYLAANHQDERPRAEIRALIVHAINLLKYENIKPREATGALSVDIWPVDANAFNNLEYDNHQLPPRSTVTDGLGLDELGNVYVLRAGTGKLRGQVRVHQVSERAWSLGPDSDELHKRISYPPMTPGVEDAWKKFVIECAIPYSLAAS